MTSITIDLEITAAPAVMIVIVNIAPFYNEPPVTNFEIFVGDAWTYTIPQYTDLEGEAVTVTASLGTAAIFTTFDSGTFNIAAGATTSAGAYTYKVTLEDP